MNNAPPPPKGGKQFSPHVLTGCSLGMVSLD